MYESEAESPTPVIRKYAVAVSPFLPEHHGRQVAFIEITDRVPDNVHEVWRLGDDPETNAKTVALAWIKLVNRITLPFLDARVIPDLYLAPQYEDAEGYIDWQKVRRALLCCHAANLNGCPTDRPRSHATGEGDTGHLRAKARYDE